ncbi:MAG TPA: NAD(P)H-dependent oxidoreductase [Phycisphaerae bacterium]|nr:NAD(P)H-dependent oxidoreductase [Phycisphaerae bacterium]
MVKILVTYYSRTDHTKHMAEEVAAAAAGSGGVEVECAPVEQVDATSLANYDGIILGSPTYYGSMAAEVKKLLDESVALHGKLAGRVGGAFSSSANIGGGNETTVMDMLKALLIHGMVVQGSASGDHYGPVAIGDVDERSRKECRKLGASVAALTVKLRG